MKMLVSICHDNNVPDQLGWVTHKVRQCTPPFLF